MNEIEKKSGLQIYKRLESIMSITSMSHLVYSQVSHATTLSVMWARLLSCDSNTGGHEDAPPSTTTHSSCFQYTEDTTSEATSGGFLMPLIPNYSHFIHGYGGLALSRLYDREGVLFSSRNIIGVPMPTNIYPLGIQFVVMHVNHHKAQHNLSTYHL